MRTLICSGDSYTDNLRPENESPLTWPNFLAKKLDVKKLINLGSSGAGNDEIFGRTIDEITCHKKIDLVVVMWSEFTRFDWQLDLRKEKMISEKRNRRGEGKYPVFWCNIHPEKTLNKRPLGIVKMDDEGKSRPFSDWPSQISSIFHEKKIDNYYAGINKFMRYVYSLQTICDQENIPLIQIMGTEPICNDGVYKQGEQALKPSYIDASDTWVDCCWIIANHPVLEKIKKNFIGWPMLRELDGFHVDDFIENHDIKPRKRGQHWPSELRIKKHDEHPNEKGHRMIGEFLYNEYKKIYLKD